jgi:tRNA G18 (ribose-2'-O)-methylase SpoU
MEDNRNVKDKYKNLPIETIKNDLKRNQLPFSVVMQNLTGDFNFSTVIRNGNAFGAKAIYYLGGRKKYDRRAAVGTQNYSSVIHLPAIEDLIALKKDYVFVGLETNIEKTVPMASFIWPKNSLIIIGEEQNGLLPDVVNLCDHLVEIEMIGSVRSLNAGCSSSIAMYDYWRKFNG